VKTSVFFKTKSPSHGLVIKNGLHSEATYPLGSNATLVIGNDESSDLVLRDESISSCHALFIVRDGTCYIKPQAGTVSINGFIRDTESRLTRTDTLLLGDVEIELSEEISSTPPMHKLVRLGIAALLIGFPVAVAAAVTMNQQKITAPAVIEFPEPPVANVEALSAEVLVAPELVQERIAENVQEVLRLSGIRASCTIIEEGVVEIKGHFGDGNSLAEIMTTRAIHEIDGLVRVVSVNLDTPSTVNATATSAGKTPAKPKEYKVKKIVDGSYPYIVLDNGSQYFTGARLPNGCVLAEINQDTITVIKSGKHLVLNGVGAVF